MASNASFTLSSFNAHWSAILIKSSLDIVSISSNLCASSAIIRAVLSLLITPSSVLNFVLGGLPLAAI